MDGKHGSGETESEREWEMKSILTSYSHCTSLYYWIDVLYRVNIVNKCS